jgi:hypothetical protein
MGMTEQQTVGAAISAVSLAMAACLGAAYPFYHDHHLQLTFQQPFADWGGVRQFYRGLGGAAYSAGNLTALAHGLAWCNKSSARPRVLPANRSAACACLEGVLQGFLAAAPPRAPVPAAVADDFGDRALACMRHRAVWDVWTYEGCLLHPVALALGLNAALGVLAGAYVLLSLDTAPGLVWALALAVLAACAGPLMAFHWQANLIFVLPLLATLAAVAYSLDDDLRPPGDDPRRELLVGENQWIPPPGLAVALWWGMPIFTAGHVAYLGASHLIRDVPALLGLALLGFLAGVLAQRHFWTRTCMVVGADGGGFRVPQFVQDTFGAWSQYLLAVALVGVWLGVGVLAYAHLLLFGPYSGWWASIAAVCLIIGAHAAEVFARGSAPALVLLANLLVGVVALVDAARPD